MIIKTRGFEPVIETTRKNTEEYIMPIRASVNSAGYDFASPVDVVIPPKTKMLIWTNIKAYMKHNEFLSLHVRSSVGIKKGLRLANVTGIIDSDYYSNKDNDGNIGICLFNDNDQEVVIEKGERIAQGIFTKYLVADNGNSENERSGGIGSTN